MTVGSAQPRFGQRTPRSPLCPRRSACRRTRPELTRSRLPVLDVAPRAARQPSLAGRRDDPPDLQAVLLGELEVALVVGGDAHDRAGAVAGQHVVGDVDRDPLAVERVDRVGADEDAGLLAVGRQALDLGLPARLLDVRLDLGPALGVVSVSTSGCSGASTMNVTPNIVSGRVVKTRSRSPPGWCSSGATSNVDLGALAAADPVRLHRLDGSGQSRPSKCSSSSA